MANTRIELNLGLFTSKRIATGVAHMLRANELFASAKSVLVAADSTIPENIAPLLGVTVAEAATIVVMVTALTNPATTMGVITANLPKIDQGVEV